MTLDEALRLAVREEVETAVADALEDVELGTERTPESETWASRVWSVEPETRLNLDQVAEALDVSTRTVRRYIAGETDHPPLPAADGVGGKVVRAVDLRTWIEEAEQAARFRRKTS